MIEFPVGYHKFHRNKFLNYQLNRWYALGYSRKRDIENVGARIKSFDDYIKAFIDVAELAIKEQRLMNAAMYMRAAEFLISPRDANKLPTYHKFLDLFNQAFAGERFERYDIPYKHSHLSAIRIPSKLNVSKGTILGIPGFDAFIEEFYGIWDFFSEYGYDVIAFEGPGQGASLRLYNHTFDHNWEIPTKSVLDYFELENVSALGLSMGGYWILRAAAYEKRIKRVIAMPPVFDWLEMTSVLNRKFCKVAID